MLIEVKAFGLNRSELHTRLGFAVGVTFTRVLGIEQKEYAVVQSTVLVIALAFVLVNLLTDLLYRGIDPRVRAS